MNSKDLPSSSHNAKRRLLLKAGLIATSTLALGATEMGRALAAKSEPHAGLTHNSTTNSYIEVAGTRYAYRRLGASKGIPLLLLQHFRGTMDWWDPAVVDGLAANRPVILFDNRGIGLTNGEVPGDIKAMATDTANFVKALGLIQIDVLGFSMGGFIAQELALAEPTLVRRVILAGTGPQGGQGSISPEILSAITQYPDAGANRAIAFFTPTAASQAAAKAFIARTQQRAEREPLSSLQAMQAQGAAIGAWGAANNSEYSQRLAQARQPFLVVNGSNDLIVATVNSVALFQAIPNAQLILYPDSGHGAIFQHHELFVKHATLFLDSVKAL